jgi:EmrB/QacA subfamily drug resistance transporter
LDFVTNKKKYVSIKRNALKLIGMKKLSAKNENRRNGDVSPKNTALLVVSITSFIFPFMASGVNIALPSISKDLSMNAVSLNWVAMSFLLAAAVFNVPFGRLGDIYGRKKLFIIGLTVFSAGSLLSGFAPNKDLLIAFRVIQGIGGSMYSGAGPAIITSVFPQGERGRALGITTASVYLGLSCGPFLGGIIVFHLGWRSLFLMNVPIYFFILWLIRAKLKGEWKESDGESFDYFGSILFGSSIMGIIYGFTNLANDFGIFLLSLGIASLVGFVVWENKVTSPIFNLSLLTKSKVFAFSNLAALINYSATFAVTILFSLYLQYAKGMSAKMAGLILVTQPAIQAIFSPMMGKLSDRIDPQIVSSMGLCITTVGLFLLSILKLETGLLFILVCLVILGFGFALFSSPNTNAVLSSVPKKYLGVASSFLATMRVTGQTMSMGITTLVFSILIGNAKISPKYYGVFIDSLHLLFIIFGCLSFAAIFASLARGKSQINENNNMQR